MKLEHISAVLRPRSEAEAVDLGLAMVRRHAAGIYRAWLTLIVPLWALLAVLLQGNPHVMVLVVWWLKPLYDRVVLFYLGRALFGAAPTLREQLREWPRLLTRRPGLSLLWGRLSGVRSFTMPVVVLEGLKGKTYRDRTGILKKFSGGAAFGFMQLFLLLELAVIVGLWTGIMNYLPEEYTEWLAQAGASLKEGIDPPQGLLWSVAGCYLAAVALLEPFYAGGGFGLYINSRTHLEGWDVDLAFRQLGNRLRARLPAATAPPPLAMLLLGLLLCLGASGPLAAQEAEPSTPAQQIKEVLAHPDFTEHIEKTRSWEPDWSWLKSWFTATPTSQPEPAGWDWSWLGGFGDAIWNFFSGDWKQVALRLLIALLITGALVWLARLIWKGHQARGPRGPAVPMDRGPRTVMGLEVTPESLPPDVPTAAWNAWQQGDPAAAVRLLYRAALAWLMQQDTGPVRESDTEGDCLRHAGVLPDARCRLYFAELTGTWLATAYGQTPPAAGTMQALCARWPFDLRAPGPPTPAPRRPALTVILMLAAVCLTGCKGQWKDHERELGHLGEAKRNPWLAATRFLEMNGLPVRQQRGVLDLPDADSVVIAPADAIHSKALARHVMDWVRDGGHLIYLAEGGALHQSDWADYSSSGPVRPESHPLPAQLGLTLSRPAKATHATGATLDGTPYRISLQDGIRFDTTGVRPAPDVLAGTPAEASLVSLTSGLGRVTLLTHAHALRNRWIYDDDHAALLLALVGQTEAVSGVYFIKAGRVNLWDMLQEQAWPALLAVGTLLLGWLWRVLPRFGPVRALPRRSERRFANHLDEAGSYLWKQKMTDALLEAPRQAVLAAARRSALREQERHFVALLATRAGLPPERVQEALYGGTLPEARVFTRQMADLQILLASFSLTPIPA